MAKTENEFPALPGMERVSGGFDPSEFHCYLASISVSLKRIADVMEAVLADDQGRLDL